MALSATRITQIEARITSLQAIADANEAAYLEAVSVGVEDYRVDTGEGSSRTKRRKLTEFDDIMESLWRQIDYWNNKLGRKGITNLNLRRKPAFVRGYYA